VSGTGAVYVSRPFEQYPQLCFARAAARSRSFVTAPSSGEPAGPHTDLLVGAASGTGEAQVRIRARGELVERMSNIIAGRYRERNHPSENSFAQLTRHGAPAMDPRAWPELAAVADVGERPMGWTSGVSLTGGGEVLVPACAVYLRHRPSSGAPAPMSPGSAGLSAHRATEPARRHGLLEVLERDLFWRAWYDLAPVAVLPGGLPGVLPGVLAATALDALELDRTTLLLPGPSGTACVAVCLADRAGRHQSFGARAVAVVDEAGLAAAIEVAIHEALMVRWSMSTPSARSARRDRTDNLSPSGPLEHALHAFYRQDSLRHLLTHVVSGPVATSQGGEPPTGAGSADLPEADLAGVLADHTGQDVVWVDTTVPTIHIEQGGQTVVGRVVAPGARRLPGSAQRLPPGLRTRTSLPHPLG
jgi:ribosomal protein S12 methylthiotransferase accessory factor